MSSPDLQMLENYLLLSQEESMQKIIKGTDLYYYLTFMRHFNEKGYQLTEEQKKQLEDYKLFKTQMAQSITLKALFLEYDSLNDTPTPESDLLRSEIIKKIAQQLFNLSFNHPQPTRVGGSSNISGLHQQVEIESHLREKVVSLETYLQEAYTEQGFKKIQAPLYIHLDLTKLAVSHINIIKAFLHNVGCEIVDFEKVPEFYNLLSERKDFKNEFTQNHFRKLSLQQIEALLELNKKFIENQFFVGELYLKKFQYNFKSINYAKFTEAEKLEMQAKMQKVFQWTLGLPPKFKSFNDQILLELLQIGIEVNDFDFELFKVYLRDPKEVYNGANNAHLKVMQKNARQYQSQWHEYHHFNVSRWVSSNKLIETYLEKYFEKFEETEPFEQYLEAIYLNKVKAQIRLYQGQELANIYESFSSSQIESMNNQKLITICTNNTMYFKHGQPVKLLVELKNIPSLNIKIFEFNSENYYNQKQQELDNNVELDGLIAFQETSFKYNEAPIVKFTKEFTFDNITEVERGIFIIEFIGNGITSRAIIKKGRLQLREKITAAGHAFQILDENFELCCSDRSGLWVDRKFYKIDKDTKEVLIPFGQSSNNRLATIVHQNYAELVNITIQQENYDLKCAFIISNEEMLMGSQAKALIYTKLFINQQESSLRLLKNPSVSIISVNDVDVPQTISLDNLKFIDNAPLEVQFPITAKIKNVTIRVSAKIERMHNNGDQKEESLEQTHSIQFYNYEGTNIFCRQFLRFTSDEGYCIHLLGKNGEPKEGIQIKVNFRLRNIVDQISQTLLTDQQGKIVLGKLDNVLSINSTVTSVRDISANQQNWDLKHNSIQNYPNTIKVLANQQITIPYLYESISTKDIALVKIFEEGGSVVIGSLTNIVKLENNNLIFQLPETGCYYLIIKNQNTQIYIKVLEGELWKNTSIIKSNQSLLIDNTLKQQIFISDINSKSVENGTLVSGKVVSQRKPQLLAIATQFVQQNTNELLAQIQNVIQQGRSEQITIELYSSVYQNNKELSDEQKYVLNRKTQERYIGNTLEKPQILLKRQLVRETNTDNEQLASGGNYSSQVQNKSQSDIKRERGTNQLYRKPQGCQVQKQNVDRLQDFLQHPGLLITDIKLNDQEFTFSIPKGFATVFVIAFNNSNIATNQIGLQCEAIATRNLCHQSALNKDKFYSIFRNSQLVKEGEKVQIQDLTSTEIKLVDSLDKIYLLLKELRNINGSDSEQNQGFVYWEFLTKWHTYQIDQKHKKYDEYQCDELNIFIYFRDPAYFETYIKSYVQNKIERSFIDSFLLLEHSVLQTMANVSRITELNALEQILLVIYYAELLNEPEKAKEIAQFLENQNKLIPINQKNYKILFDTALGAKTEDDNQEQFDQGLEFGGGGLMMQQQHFSNAQQFQPLQSVQVQTSNLCYQTRMTPSSNLMQRCSAAQPQFDLLDIICYDECQKDMKDDFDCFDIQRPEHYEHKRGKLIENFKNIEKTKEFGELHYCKVSRPDQSRYLVPINGFWVDLANHSINKGVLKEDFLTSKFIYCNSNHTQMIAVLAFIGLPDEAPVQEYKQFQGKGVEITTKKSAILFTKEIKEGKAQLRSDILVAQRFFDPQDRFTYTEEDPDLQLEKDVEECLVNRIYGCQIIVTNCSSTRADYQVLIEVPNGAIPVNTVAYTKSYTIPLQPYSTQRLEYFFYFPSVGNYTVYPANVSRFGQVVCVAKDSSLKVVLQKSVADLEVLDDILAKGSKDDILKFLSTKNIFNPNIFRIHEILYLLKDKEFYLKVIDILRTKRFLDYDAWSYSVYHNDTASLKEFFNLERSKNVLNSRFKYFKCSLFEISNIRFFEYYPLITKRIHKLTQEAKGILNVEFREQYMNFLMYLSQKGIHSVGDKLVFIYYLLLQERINEAIQVYKSITDVPAEGDSILQYDYFTAYLDFYIGYPNFIKARAICEKYMNYPVIHWRNLFYEIVNQLVEYDGEDDENQKLKVEQTQKNKHLDQAKKEETLTSVIEGNNIIVTYSNLSSLTLQFYKIDLEVLFSSNPFLNKSSEDFSFVLPNLQIAEQLKGEQQEGLTYKQTIEIPEQLRSNNLFVQIKGVNKHSSNRYFSTSLNVQIMENHGQIRVADSKGKYLAKVYVKAYIKEKNGTESFYKDGYTDLRGRFDYASLSSAQLGNAEKFSIFITSDELGSVIKEVNAPAQVGQFEAEVKLVSKAWNQRAEQEHQVQAKQYECQKKLYKNYK